MSIEQEKEKTKRLLEGQDPDSEKLAMETEKAEKLLKAEELAKLEKEEEEKKLAEKKMAEIKKKLAGDAQELTGTNVEIMTAEKKGRERGEEKEEPKKQPKKEAAEKTKTAEVEKAKQEKIKELEQKEKSLSDKLKKQREQYDKFTEQLKLLKQQIEALPDDEEKREKTEEPKGDEARGEVEKTKTEKEPSLKQEEETKPEAEKVKTQSKEISKQQKQGVTIQDYEKMLEEINRTGELKEFNPLGLYGEIKRNVEYIIKKMLEEELENPKITEEEFFEAYPGSRDFYEKHWGDDIKEKQKRIEAGINDTQTGTVGKAKSSFKYLQGKIGPRELIHTEPYHYVRENINEEEAKKYADEEAKKWKFLFDRINKKYNDMLASLEQSDKVKEEIKK